MPVVGIPHKRYEIYCPVCGYKYKSIPYIDSDFVGSAIIKPGLDTVLTKQIPAVCIFT